METAKFEYLGVTEDTKKKYLAAREEELQLGLKWHNKRAGKGRLRPRGGPALTQHIDQKRSEAQDSIEELDSKRTLYGKVFPKGKPVEVDVYKWEGGPHTDLYKKLSNLARGTDFRQVKDEPKKAA